MAGIINSAQTTPDYTAQAQQLYQDHLKRAGDPDGVNYWAGQFAAGRSLDDITKDFKSDARGVYSDVMNNPSSINASNPYIQGDLTQIGKTNAAAEASNDGTSYGTPTGILSAARQQTDARQGLNSNIYNDLYGGGTTSGAGSSGQGGVPSPAPGAGGPNAGGNGAATYNPALLGDPTKWNVTPNQTVEGRITGILNADNPIIQQARTQALQQANSRGILNSTMATEAGQSAAYGAALPIASADAATAAKAAGYNADENNQFSVANQNAKNTGGQFNASAQNTLAGQQLAASTQLATANISANTQRYMSDQSAATQMAVSKMSTQSQQAISQLHDANSVLLQNNQAAQQAYSNYVNAVANIDIQNTMDATAKAAAIKTQTDIFNNAISGLRGATSGTPDVSSPLNVSGSNANVTQAVSDVGGVDVSHMLDFGQGGAGA